MLIVMCPQTCTHKQETELAEELEDVEFENCVYLEFARDSGGAIRFPFAKLIEEESSKLEEVHRILKHIFEHGKPPPVDADVETLRALRGISHHELAADNSSSGVGQDDLRHRLGVSGGHRDEHTERGEFFAKLKQHDIGDSELTTTGFIRQQALTTSSVPPIVSKSILIFYHEISAEWGVYHCHDNVQIEDNIVTRLVGGGMGYNNVFVVGDYSDKSAQIFKFRLKRQNFGVCIGMATPNPHNAAHLRMGKQPDTYCVDAYDGAVLHNNEVLVETQSLREDAIVTIELGKGTICFYVDKRRLGEIYELKKDFRFKIGVALYDKNDAVELV